jgi:hypothetical protein
MAPAKTLSSRRLTTALVVIASVIAFFAIFAVWVKRQALDTDEWTTTSSELLQKKAIHEAVATDLVDELYANVDVAAELRGVLPPDARSWRSSLSRARPAGTASSEDTRLDRLERLAALHDRDVLSQEELDTQKAALLG